MVAGSFFASCVCVIRLGDRHFYPLSHLASSLLEIVKIKVKRTRSASSSTQFLPCDRETPHILHTIILLLLCNCNFSTVLNCDVMSDMQAMWYVTHPPHTKGLRTAALEPRSSGSAPPAPQ